MTKAVFNKIVEDAGGSPMFVYGDNMLLFQLNMQGSYYLQDADNIYCIRVNKTAGGQLGVSQQESPYEVVVFNFDEIQYIKVFPDKEILTKFIDGKESLIEGETVDEIKKAIMTSQLLLASSPRGYSGSDQSVNRFGSYPGVSVSMGEQDPYAKKYMEQFNNKETNEG